MLLCIQTNDGNCVADLLETVMPEALSEAVEKNTDLRRSLPRNFHSFMGVAASENDEDPLRYHMNMSVVMLSSQYVRFSKIFSWK